MNATSKGITIDLNVTELETLKILVNDLDKGVKNAQGATIITLTQDQNAIINSLIGILKNY